MYIIIIIDDDDDDDDPQSSTAARRPTEQMRSAGWFLSEEMESGSLGRKKRSLRIMASQNSNIDKTHRFGECQFQWIVYVKSWIPRKSMQKSWFLVT